MPNQKTPPSDPQKFEGHILDENGEEVLITDEMVCESMADIKLQSIGVHTGFTKIVSDEMLKKARLTKVKN